MRPAPGVGQRMSLSKDLVRSIEFDTLPGFTGLEFNAALITNVIRTMVGCRFRNVRGAQVTSALTSKGGTSTPTVTIANNAVSPKNITVTRGSQVTFVNNDNQSHDMESDPHPIHTDCPEINQVGLLSPGQSRRTGILNIARVCGYHDHDRDMVESLRGTITIQ
jgi:plastocyanin